MTVDVTEARGASATPLVPEPPRVETKSAIVAPPPPPPPPPPAPPSEPAPSIELAKDSRIRGRAILDGRIPRRKDDETQIVHRENRGIRNVFVYVKKVDGRFEVPREAIELSFCDFSIGPRVVGAREGQDIAVTNLDNEVQNFHALPRKNAEKNWTSRPGDRDVFRLNNAEVMVRITCDIHPWERAYVGVLAHPYFSVTDDNGAFELPAIGPGEYDLVAWHEVYGELVKRVVVAERTDPVEFIFVRR